MAGAFIGVSGVAREVKQPYIGVSSVARKVIVGYIGVSGVARKFFDKSGLPLPLTIYDRGTLNSNFTVTERDGVNPTNNKLNFYYAGNYIVFGVNTGVTVRNCTKLCVEGYANSSDDDGKLRVNVTYADGTTVQQDVLWDSSTVMTKSIDVNKDLKITEIKVSRLLNLTSVYKIWLE